MVAGCLAGELQGVLEHDEATSRYSYSCSDPNPNPPVYDISNRSDPRKTHESDIDSQLTQFPPKFFAHRQGDCPVHFTREELAQPTRDERDDGSIPELGSRGMKGRDEVDDTNQEDTFHGPGKGREVQGASVVFFPSGRELSSGLID